MRTIIAAAILVVITPALFCQETKGTPTPEFAAPKVDDAARRRSLPGHEGLEYEVEARSFIVRNDDGQEKAEIFHTYYRLAGADPAERPISFIFNGGPGSSSVWLHLGGLGPKRVLMTDEGEALPPPGRLVDNEHNWLRFSDLVFIDPVGTGFSRPLDGVDGKEFYGLDEDIRWVGEFIRLFCSKEKRWGSKKFLVGESYGTTRAAGLALHLQSQHDMYLNGIVLVSPILDFGTARFDFGHDLAYICFLPTYAAIAHHHGRAGSGESLESFVESARSFALNDYALALMQGDALAAERRTRIAERIASFIGLSAAYVLNADLRVKQHQFRRELLRDEDLSVGRMDGRFTGPEGDGVSASPELDHSLTAITGPYASAVKDYFARELGYENELQYRILTGKVHPWSYSSHQNRYVNVAERLRKAMAINPHLQVHVCCGYQDLATPFLAMEYTRDHMGLRSLGPGRMSFSYYPAGHMMYVHLPSLQRLAENVGVFYEQATR